jgi:hypothetical protein
MECRWRPKNQMIRERAGSYLKLPAHEDELHTWDWHYLTSCITSSIPVSEAGVSHLHSRPPPAGPRRTMYTPKTHHGYRTCPQGSITHADKLPPEYSKQHLSPATPSANTPFRLARLEPAFPS